MRPTRSTNSFSCALAVLLGFGFANVQHSCSWAATVQTEQSTQSQGTIAEVNSLVKEFYPKSKITQSEKSLHFEFKAHERQNPYSNRIEMSPDLGGVIGDLQIKPGESKDKDKLPTERHETIHSVLLMAPYSAPTNSHLETRLVFQPDTPIEFMTRFRELINTYKSGDSVGQSTASKEGATKSESGQAESPVKTESTPVAAKEAKTAGSEQSSSPAVATATSTPAVQPSATNSGVSFGTAKMSKYTYPEGRFRVSLPGSPQQKYATQAGLRMVDYVYPEAHGTFNVSYVILPQQPNPAMLDALVEKISQSLVTSVKGSNIKQAGATLQSFPGRQIDIAELKDKPGQSAKFKIFVVRRYIYIVGVAGKKAWLNSPIANEFISSFNVTPELTASEELEQKRLESERQRSRASEDFDRRRREFDQRFSDSLSRNRKEHEKFNADFQNNRFR